MPAFRYQAVSKQGEQRNGTLAADSLDAAVARIQAMGLIPVAVEEAGQGAAATVAGKAGRRARPLRRKRLGAAEIGEFTRQLSILVGAGLTLERSLDIIQGVTSNLELREMVQGVQADIRGGQSLSRALHSHPQLFSNFYISFINAAEISGTLDESLRNLSAYLEKARALREHLVSAMIYPSILVGVTLLSLGVILVFVLPEFSQLFADMDAELPASTALVLAIADGIAGYGLSVLALVLVLAWLVRKRLAQPARRKGWDRFRLGLPLLGDLLRKVETARLSRSLGTLLRGGVPILQSIAIARETLGNAWLATRVDEVAQALQDGAGLAVSLIESREFPEFAMQMIQVGEETGELDATLLKVADIYDEEMAIATRRLLSVLEPALIISLGLVIGGIIMSILVAIMSINQLPI